MLWRYFRLHRAVGAAVLSVLAAVSIFVWPTWPRMRQWLPAALTICYSGPAQAETVGQHAYSAAEGDVLLVIDRSQMAAASSSPCFEAVKWDYAWLNFLEQEAGGMAAVCDRDRLDAEILKRRRLVVFASSAAFAPPSSELLSLLSRFVQDGGCLILETPRSSWRYLSGGVFDDDTFNASAGASRGSLLRYEKLPHAPDRPSQEGEHRIAQAPLFSFVHATQCVDPGVQRCGLIRDVPAFWQRRWGQGWVVSLAFNWGIQLQAMQQGAPCQGWQVREVSGFIPGMVESQDMALNRDLVDNDRPYADMLEDWLADYCEGALRLWPRWWRFPYEFDGALAVTHDEEDLGPQRFSGLWQLEERLKLRSTVFLICPTLAAGQRWRSYAEPYRAAPSWAGSAEMAVTLGVHWSRFWPYVPLSVQERYAGTGGMGEHFSRIHYLLWGRDYAEPFRNMAAAGIVLDSSYGPNRGRGYLFCTGLPFQVLDDNGRPLGLWEWPFEAQEDIGGVDGAYMDRLIDASALDFHQALVVLLHPHRWVSRPSGQAYLESIAGRARERRHWLVNFSDYWSFMQARRRARLSSTVRGGVLDAEAEAPEPGMALVLSGSAVQITVNGQPAQVRAVRINGENHWLAAVPQGVSRISARYRE